MAEQPWVYTIVIGDRIIETKRCKLSEMVEKAEGIRATENPDREIDVVCDFYTPDAWWLAYVC